MPLVHTSFYGIREYHRGAELRMHVDRVATHVFSVIINVDQVGVDEPWPLELIDFELQLECAAAEAARDAAVS
jgi:prolyl 4-hydroxylase